jgi:proteasome lid subunit RPN8/RPN11
MPEKVQSRILEINRQTWELMRTDVAHKAPEEACGLLAGRIQGEQYQATLVYPTTNLLHSTTRFRIDPAEQLAAFNQIDSQGLKMVGIYHSHPNGPAGPSPTDIAEAYYPEAAYLIWSRQGSEWICTAYAIVETTVYPVSIQILARQD